jgi:hypothetical protein
LGVEQNETISNDGADGVGDAQLDESLLGEDIVDAVTAESGDNASGGFAPIKKRFEETGHKVFDDPAYYKTALAGGGDLVQRLHSIFQKLTQAKDPKDRTQFRLQIIPAFWEYMGNLARQTVLVMADSKRFLLRFGLLHPGLLTAETRKLFSTVIVKKTTDEPVFYLDEWFAGIGMTDINPSSTDEARSTRGNPDARLKELLDKANGKLDGARGMLRSKDKERLAAESQLSSRVMSITTHTPSRSFGEVNERYTETQKKMFLEMQDLMKSLLKIDREIESSMREYEEAKSNISTLSGKISASGEKTTVDTGAIDGEFQTVRQIAKMTIGRQGNTFPILSGEYFNCMPNGIGTRENVLSVLSWIESIDEEVYCRIYKNKPVRIVPYVILVPTYGDLGVCWEPYERLNKATSRGRIAVPMYPKNLTIAILSAVADLRWQVAKEKASYYWMEEGLTGNYYQWFAKQKLKGDIKWYFIQDYLLWMTKESEGVQKLDKEVRGVFWRYMPFTRPVKEKLKDRNLIYQELYQRDLNRAMSDL